MNASFRLMRPLVVMIVFAGFIVIAAGVLMVALAHLISHILTAILCIHIAYEALRLSTMRAGELLLTMSCQFGSL